MKKQKKVRLLIADDHEIVRKGLRALLETRAEVEVVGEAANGREALSKAAQYRPDLILLDLVMPGKDGLEVIKEIKNNFPSVKILVLTSYSEEEKLAQALKEGALGYLLKDSSPEELLEAIKEVSQGKTHLSPELAFRVVRLMTGKTTPLSNSEFLTKRELEVLNLLAQGLSDREIAQRLFISPRTVGTHVSNILTKLGVKNRTQAVLLAQEKGLVKKKS
ncbi:MAG: DNA-binding response regulator [Candidatus Aminicenantes bacterium 4484_214]|nr:MAG: DNA-binding response regulator [Candidatus Aminicenantes bacterium 4484_214]